MGFARSKARFLSIPYYVQRFLRQQLEVPREEDWHALCACLGRMILYKDTEDALLKSLDYAI